jgi:hypothetical protein
VAQALADQTTRKLSETYVCAFKAPTAVTSGQMLNAAAKARFRLSGNREACVFVRCLACRTSNSSAGGAFGWWLLTLSPGHGAMAPGHGAMADTGEQTS